MSISIDKQFGVHQHALQLRSQRAGVLANNIANADTPGYKARDFDFQSMLSSRMGETSEQLNLETTQSRHVSTLLQGETIGGLKFRNPSQPAIDGNTVDVHIEQAEFTENALRYQATLGFIDGKIKSIKKALGEG